MKKKASSARKSTRTPKKKAAKRAVTPKPSGKPSILVVDDEQDIRTTVRALLEKDGYAVTTAVNGDDCLRQLTKRKPDLILLDVMMPGTSAREVVKRAKGVRIAFLTVVRTTDAEREELLREKNIVGFIQKPFEIEPFLQTVHKLLAPR